MATMKKTKKYQDGGSNGTAGQGKLGPAIGITIPTLGGLGMAAKAISDRIKRKKKEKEEAERNKMIQEAKNMPAGKTGGYMMTGGMVNSNAKVSALKQAGSKGVKSGVNPKASASKVAKGRSGGTSKAPKDATPKKNKKG
jgi:hypothetical protein